MSVSGEAGLGPLAFIVPGSINQLTGGYIFDRRLVETLRAGGRPVEVIELDGCFPMVDTMARASATAALSRLCDGALVVIDGLALPAFAESLAAHASRLRVLAFVHHPLSLETGLEPVVREQMAALEARLWSMMRGIVCPSESSARSVAAAGIERSRIAVAPPGTDRVAPARGRVGDPCADAPSACAGLLRQDRSVPAPAVVRLLAVGTLTRRKGHLLLIDALSHLPATLAWRLDCIGSIERDPVLVAELRDLVQARGLADRVRLHGEVEPSRLDAAYAAADLFVLPSWHEGYGMVFAEALARGLPVISTTGGAIPDTVPAAASRLIEPGDRAALTAALAELIGDGALRARLSSAARTHAERLSDWPAATAHWIAAVERLAAVEALCA